MGVLNVVGTIHDLRTSCLKKSRYNTEAKATRYMAKAQADRPEPKLRTYYCKWCAGFHITSKPLREKSPETQLTSTPGRGTIEV